MRPRELFGRGELRPGRADAADLLRPLCAFFIGWYHIWQQSWQNPNFTVFGRTVDLYRIVSAGYMFVDLMLLLSGFLLMLCYLEKPDEKLSTYYKKRALRILPGYLLCVGIMLFGFALPQGAYMSAKHLRVDVLAHLSFTHNLFQESYMGTRLNGVLWTLAVEVQFYAVFPFLARLFKKKPYLVYALMVSAGWLARGYVYLMTDSAPQYINRLTCMLDVYANGMMAALLFHRARRKRGAARAWLSTLLALAALAGIFALVERQSLRSGDAIRPGQLLLRYPLSFAGALFLFFGSRSIAALRALCSNRLTLFLGGLSYNFYIWHQWLAVKLKEWRIPAYEGENPNFTGQQPWQPRYTLICFAAALIVAALITYGVEKPLGRMFRRTKKISK